MTKHPKRNSPPPPPGAQSNGMGNYLSDEQRIEAAHRANFVRELIIGEHEILLFCFSSIMCCIPF
jgi:sorting nexin-13